MADKKKRRFYCRQKATLGSGRTAEDEFWVVFGVEVDCGKLWRGRLPGAPRAGPRTNYKSLVVGVELWWTGVAGQIDGSLESEPLELDSVGSNGFKWLDWTKTGRGFLLPSESDVRK